MVLWSEEHVKTLLPALGLMLVLGLILRQILKNKPLLVRYLPLQIIAVILLILEIGKQTVSFWQGYDLYHIPLHFCSLFIFMLPLMAFYHGRHAQAVRTVTTALCAAVFALMLIYPELIYSGNNVQLFFSDYLSLHTVTFHNLVMLAAVLIVALDLHTPGKKGETRQVALFTMGFCATAAVAAQLLKTNYANFYQCNIPVLETVRQAVQNAVGALPAQLLYILIVASLHTLFTVGAWWLYRLVEKAVHKKANIPA